MDRKGIILKKLITFSDVFLLNNFTYTKTTLDVIAENKLLSFSVSRPKLCLIYSDNWIIKSSSINQLEFFNLSHMKDSKSYSGFLKNDILKSSLGQLNGLLKTASTLSESSKNHHYVLENLGIIKNISIYQDEYISVLCRTDKTFRVLVLRLSDINQMIHQNLKSISKKNNEWMENDEYDNSDEDSEVDSDISNKKVDFYQLIKFFKGNELRDVQNIYCLGETFLAIYGKVIKLLDENMKVIKTWMMESTVNCVKELIMHPGSEVNLLFN
jgi:hypothetical protein